MNDTKGNFGINQEDSFLRCQRIRSVDDAKVVADGIRASKKVCEIKFGDFFFRFSFSFLFVFVFFSIQFKKRLELK